ncbi:hypothetical protein [Bacillus sp. 1P06AnD]|uniref:hypothetical protein n=1 Tax=Bacillus sp. 1P06AnD TaxID=3132208 RepID=UPI00399F4FB8
MGNQQWSESDIEDSLANMPKISDKRDPEWIYAKVKRVSIKKKKRRKWIPVTISSMTFICIATLATVSFIQNSPSESKMENSSGKQLATEQRTDRPATKKREAAQTEQSTSNQSNPPINEKVEKKPADPGNKVAIAGENDVSKDKDISGSSREGYVTIAFPLKEQGLVVPITVPVEENTIEAKLKAFLNKPTEGEWSSFGLNNEGISISSLSYVPSEQAVEWQQEKTDNENLEQQQLWKDSLVETLRYLGIPKLIINQEDGRQGETIPVDPHPKRAIMVYDKGMTSSSLFVPTSESYPDLKSAVETMKISSSVDGISPSIPEDAQLRISEEGKTAVVTYLNDYQFQNDEQGMTAVDAILMAAHEFGFDFVQFRNSTVDQMGEYRLNEKIEVPDSPNVIN